MSNPEFDLIILTADNDMEWTIRTLLEKRAPSLAIRPVKFSIYRHPRRDNGVFHEAPNFMRLYRQRARYALVLLDREGSGQEERLSAAEIEDDIEQRVHQVGWPAANVAAIALDPELEIWVWSRSSHVARVLNVTADELTAFLNEQPLTPQGKPKRPKEALQQVLQQSGRPFSAGIFQELAESVSLQENERAFNKLRQTLQNWFPL